MAIRHAAALLLLLAMSPCARPAEAREPVKSFSIARGALDRALALYAEQAGVELIYRSDEVRAARSPGVSGAMARDAALQALLTGSGFVARRDPSGAVAIVRLDAVAASGSRGSAVSRWRAAPGEDGRSPADQALGEIVVTARKRPESNLKAPVIETVLTEEMLTRAQVNDMVRLTTHVPGLLIGNGVLAIGPQISLRGVGTTTQDAGVDQSVSLNLDGLSVAQGLAYRAGLFDVAQVEVLRGPQALFYGKSSTGGVISLRTNDPGDRLEVVARTGYDFEADEARAEMILSTPVTDSFGIRLAGLVSDMEGFFHNRAVAAPGTGALTPHYSRYDNSRAYILRGTLKWEPSSSFDARIKANLTSEGIEGDASHNQMRSCPDGVGAIPGTGIRFLNPNDDCKLDRTSYWVDMDPAAFAGIRNNGVPFLNVRQRYGTLELNYHPASALTLTSVTGYYRLKTDTFINSAQSGYAAPPLATDNSFRRRDLTEEIRANSDFAGPINFTTGYYRQDARVFMLVSRSINRDLPFVLPALQTRGTHDVHIRTDSLFAQLRWTAASEVEVAGGVRWADERRSELHINLYTNSVVPLAVNAIRARNWSPEFTVTWTPTNDVTMFGSLKQAYKSGGFTLTQVLAPGSNNSFGDERVRGGEVGLKARLDDRSMRLDLAGYRYEYRGLQVGTTETSPVTGLPLARTLNAAAASVYGIDFDLVWRPPALPGLELSGAVNWTHARFTDLHGVPCWGGQTIAEGCNEFLNPATGRYTAQGLDGLRMIRAPDWQLQAGADYTLSVGGGFALNLGGDGQYTSRYPTALSRRADVVMPGFLIVNAHAALSAPDKRWELALIGNDIGNRITYASCTQANYANGSVLSGEITGGTTRGPAGIDEVACAARRGREVWLRLTLRPSAKGD
jgi:iron complex outermembrane receptor protein